MSNLKIGKRVRLLGFVSKIPDKYNPKDIEGTIVSVTGDMNPYIVEWDNGLRNSYCEKNLEIV